MIENLDLTRPVELAIQTVVDSGVCSEKSVTHFNEAVMMVSLVVAQRKGITVMQCILCKTLCDILRYYTYFCHSKCWCDFSILIIIGDNIGDDGGEKWIKYIFLALGRCILSRTLKQTSLACGQHNFQLTSFLKFHKSS